MKKIISGGSIKLNQNVFPIWGNENRPLFEEILLKTYEQMQAMLSHHCKILVIRFDYRMSEYTEDNQTISELFRVLKKQLTQHYNFKRIGHLWVREQNKSDKQHYHCALMVDANKVRHPSKIIERIQMISDARNQLAPFIPKNCYYVINRGEIERFSDAFYRLSYLSKVETKDQRTGSNNDYSTSRIKPKHKDLPRIINTQ